MRQVERHLIKPSHNPFKEIDNLCFLSKNLYNFTLYLVRQEFFKTGKILSFTTAYHQIKTGIDYKSLPSKVSQLVIKQVVDNFSYWRKALAQYKKHPEKFLGCPKMPKYKDKIKGRNKLTYNNQAFSKTALKQGFIKLSKIDFVFKTKQTSVDEVRLISKSNGTYYLEVVYSIEEKKLVENNNYASIDIGLNNLATVATNNPNINPIIINGKPIKSCNRWFNKRKAYLQSKLPKDSFSSKKLDRLSIKRANKIDYYLHESSKQVIDYLKKNEITNLVIGKNDNWKQNINIGKKNNQNFTGVPHAKFIEILTYKAQKEGIKVVTIEESYTSKTSFLDKEKPEKQNEYLGKRVKRGLFKSSSGKKINADLNGALQILTKVVGNFTKDFSRNSILRLVVSPVRLSLRS
jgi:IS605 OrfB family transposase